MMHTAKFNRTSRSGLFFIALSVSWFSSGGPALPYDTSSQAQQVSIIIEGMDPVEQIEMKLLHEQDEKKVAVLRGLLWVVEFMEEDKHFDFVFSDYLLFLREFTLDEDDEFTPRIAVRLIGDAFVRAESRLKKVFPASTSGKWDYISIIPFIYQFNVAPGPYLKFYSKRFPEKKKRPYKKTFSFAVKKYDYDLLGDYLIDYSFLHFLNEDYPGHNMSLPKDRFEEFVEHVSTLEFIYDRFSVWDSYHDQNYFITHIVYVATNYGQEEMENEELEKRVLVYLKDNLEFVRYDVGDIDLLAEFAHCLNLLGRGEDPDVQESVDYLFSEQNEDGSWGTETDFKGDFYDQFHPTWAVATAIYSFI